MNKRRKTLLIALLSIFTTAGVLAACSTVQNIIEVPKDGDYSYTNPDDTSYTKPDEGFVIDGKADEAAYKNTTWVNLINKNGNNTVDLAMTSYFGEKGMYFIYDVTESTPIYVNPNRASYINSGIEMYFAPKGVSSMSSDHIYEIDLEADGTVTVKKSAGIGGSWVDVGTTSDIMAYVASQPKGGEINSGDCYGYTLEFFIPWDYVEWLGMNPETMKEEYVSVNPVHITSYNYEGKDHNIDRYWYSFATQLGGDGWGNVDKYFRFDKDGVVGTLPVTLSNGEHCTISGPGAAIAGLPVNITVTPENGYAVSSLKCNNAECIKAVNYNSDGSVVYTVVANSSLAFSAEAEAVTAGNKNLTGSIALKKSGGDTFNGLIASYFDDNGEHALPLDASGNFTLNDLAQGYYTLSVEKKGYGKVTRGIYLNRNIDLQIDLEYGMFDVVDGTCWDVSGANDGYIVKKGGRGAILSKDSYGTFYAEANFRYDAALASMSSADEYYQQRMGFRIKFSSGKYWHPDVMCEGGSYKVTYGKILNNDSIFNWNTVYVMNAKQIAKYKSEEGIKLGILRVGATAYIYLDGELIAETNLGAEGIGADETAQIGFEGFANNIESWRIDYQIQDENADSVALGEVETTGATVALDGRYAVGQNAVLVLNKQNASDVLLSLVINGEEMSGDVVNEDGVDKLVINNNTARILNVEAIYGEPCEITANISVDPEWNANGLTFTFTNVNDSSIVKTVTVTDNKMTVENMLQGLYTVQVNVFGATLDLGNYAVVSEEEKLLKVENVFINGKVLDPSVIDLSTGSFIYNSAIDEDYSIKVNEQGDSYLAVKLSLSEEDKAKLLRSGEVSFGMYMTVVDADGKAHTHFTDFWIKNLNGEDLLTIRTDFGWSEDFCKPFTTQVDSNKYTQALFGDGLYVVLRYKSETGVMETYFGTNDFSVTYLRDWNDSDHLFPANGTVTQLGFRDSLSWGGSSVSVKVENFRYGKTLLESLGVAGKTVAITSSNENGSVSWNKTSYTAGEDISCTIDADEGYFVDRVTVNGVDVTHLLNLNTLTLKGYTSATLDINVEIMQSQNLASVTLTVDEAWKADGLSITLARDGYDSMTGVVENGKLVLENVMQGTWIANMEIFGAPVSMQLIIVGDTQIDLGKVFAYEAQAKGNVNVGNNSLTYHGNKKEDLGINANITGSAWFVGKVSLSEADVATLLNGNQVGFGMYVTFSDGTYKYVGWNLANKAGDMHLCLTDGEWWDDGHTWGNGCDTKLGTIKPNNTYELSKYGEALFGGDGLYYILNYNAETGYLSVYYATSTVDVVLAKEMGYNALKNGTIVKFGVNCGIGWGDAPVTFNVTEYRYGATLAQALGVAGKTIEVTGAGRQDHGLVTVTENATCGSDVTVTLAPDSGYKIASLTVNGTAVDVSAIVNGAYTLKNYVGATLEIEAVFEEIVKIDANVSINGRKLGFDGNAANGLEATLSDGVYTYTGTVADGKVTFNQVIAGDKYTLSIPNFLPVTGIVVTESGIDGTVTLDYDTFGAHRGWGSWNFANQNSTGEIISTNEAEAAFTKDLYSDVVFTLYLGQKEAGKDCNQGIAFRFGNEVITLRMEGTSKIQFCERGWILDDLSDASGNTWDDLIFFETGDKYLQAYANGTLKLTCVRRGATFYVYLNGDYIGQRTFNGYETAKANVGFFYHDNLTNGTNKTFKVEIADNIKATVTDVTADTANGTLTFSKTQLNLGETVTVTVAPASGYKLAALKVNGKDVTSIVSNNSYTFAVSENNEVEAEFALIVNGSVNAQIIGNKLYSDGNSIAIGTQVVLKSLGENDVTATVTANGLSVESLVAGVWSVNVEGYLPVNITVEANASYTETITLEYDLMKNLAKEWGWGDGGDLSKQNQGEYTHTNGLTLWHVTNDTFDLAAITVNVKPDISGRQGAMIKFGNDYVMIQLEKTDDGYKVSWNADNGYSGWGTGVNNITGSWDAQVSSLSEEQIAAMNAGNFNVTLVRDKNVIYAYVNGEYCNKLTLDEKYADMKCQVGFYGTDVTVGAVRKFNVSTTFDLSDATDVNA